MSHFSVLVITPDEPTDDLLQKVLLPWHEYECTGIEEYLVDVDQTDEITEQFNERQKVVVLADGRTLSRWDEAFYTGKPEWQFGNKTFVLPAGAVEKELPADEARALGIGYKTMDEAAESWSGAKRGADGRFYKRTNPNKKWDWWSRGGRYRGRLLTKERAMAYEGRAGAFDNGPQREGGVDSCRVSDLDIDRMRDDAERKAAKDWDSVHAVIAGRHIETWDKVRKKHGKNIDAARSEYWEQPAVKDLRQHELCRFDGPDEFVIPREQYLSDARKRALSAFAVVKDGKWYERSDMGWWGVVHDEKDRNKWDDEFAALIDGLPASTWLSIVDCHI